MFPGIGTTAEKSSIISNMSQPDNKSVGQADGPGQQFFTGISPYAVNGGQKSETFGCGETVPAIAPPPKQGCGQ